jgi:hypothetical protein
MLKQNSESLKISASPSADTRKGSETASSGWQRYHQPEVYQLGSLEQIQLGSHGNNIAF